MSSITKTRRHIHLLVAALAALLLSGCVSISDPIMIEEPSPIPPSPTEVVVTMLEPSPTTVIVLEKVVLLAKPIGEVIPTPQARLASAISRAPRPTATATPAPIIYIVEAGDTLGFIAQKHEISLQSLLDINAIDAEQPIKEGDELVIPSATDLMESVALSGTPIPTPQTESGHIIHFVQVGETLSAIAAQYEIERLDLLRANGLRPDAQLVAGDTLIIPQGPYTAIPTPTPELATPVPTVVLTLVGSPTAEPSPTPSPAAPVEVTHVVRSGEIAGRIAKDYNVTLAQLEQANPGVALDRLSVGQSITIPGQASSAPVAALPTGTPTATPVAAVVTTHVVLEGQDVGAIARTYGVSEAEIRDHNEAMGETLWEGQILKVPLGTPTPTPTPRPLPSATPTRVPAFLAPIPLLPTDGSSFVYRPERASLQLIWTSSGILDEDEFYVVRLRAVDTEGEVLWSETHWTKAPNWKVDPQLLAGTRGRVTLRWDVMVMRETTRADDPSRRGVALSDKSMTYEIRFTNRN